MRYRVKFTQPIEIRAKGTQHKRTLKANTEYVVNGDLLKVLERIHGKKVKRIDEVTWTNTVSWEKAKNVLLYRAGGIGDIIFILPYLSSLKKLNPKMHITFCTMHGNKDVLSISKYVDAVLEDPIEFLPMVGKYDKVITFDRFIEENPEAEKTNAFDIGKKFFDGIERGPFESTITPGNPVGEKIHLAISIATSSKIRDISPAIWFDFLHNLNPDKFRITLVAPPMQEKDVIDIAQSVAGFNPNLEIRKLVEPSLLTAMKFSLETDPPHVGIGADSGWVNLWGYHGVPVIGLYGPFDSWLRMKYYERALGIDVISKCIFGKNENGSCFLHKTGSCDLADFKDELFAPCLHQIDSDHILEAVEWMIKKFY